MYRLITRDLQNWKNAETRKPLILKVIRKCGKTWILKEFGKQNFTDTVYFTFENNTPQCACFDQDMDPARIIKELSFLSNKTITPGTTLVIFDEIQFCPNALTSLKYFCEEMPKLHIACAGSLLGVQLAKKEGSFPVGKTDFLTLRPMNFAEYLYANGETYLLSHLETLLSDEMVPASLTQKLENLYKDYLVTGGMPEVVKIWTNTHDLQEIERIQRSIIDSYEADFMKYAPRELLPKLSLIWNSVPQQLAKDNHKFIFSHIKKGLKARDLEDALHWLVSAGIILKMAKIEKPAVPLSHYADSTNFKIYLCDVGLLRSLAAFPAAGISSPTPVVSDMRGALTENYVLTELLAANDAAAYFWKRNESEIEFIIQNELDVIPIEVKAAKNTRSRSLNEYRKHYTPLLAIKTSLKNISKQTDEMGTLLEIPLYLIWNTSHYL